MHIIDDTSTTHIFSGRPGHIPDTPANRRLLEDVANDLQAWIVDDVYGNSWYARTDAIGRQVWAKVRDGRVISGGMNDAPRPSNPRTGLSAPTKKQWRKNHGND